MGSAIQRIMESGGATLTRALAKTRRREDHLECSGLLRLAEKVKQSGSDVNLFLSKHFKKEQVMQTWNLSKILHRRIFRLKILNRQFHLISTVSV